MSAANTDRVLAASLHQAIAELVPARLEFYEYWLQVGRTRRAGLGRAPLAAVLGFLRAEGDRYPQVMHRAGRWAARWVADEWPPVGRRLAAALPAPVRARIALHAGQTFVRRLWAASRTSVHLRGRHAKVELVGSVFCEPRDRVREPQCGFYAAAFAELFARLALAADARLEGCRAVGDPCCVVAIGWRPGATGAAAPYDPEVAA